MIFSGLRQPLGEALVLPPQPLDLDPGRVGRLGAALARQGLERSGLALAAPIDQVRGVQPLAAQQRADLARLGAGVGLTQDRELVLGAEAPPLGLLGHLGIGWAGHGLRIDPGPGCRHRHGHELGVLPLALVTEYRGRSVSAHAGREAKDTDTLTKARPASAPPGPPCPAGARWATPPCSCGQRLRGLATMTARRWATCQHETASRTTSQLLGLPAKPRLGALLSSDNFGSSVGRSSGRHVLWQRLERERGFCCLGDRFKALRGRWAGLIWRQRHQGLVRGRLLVAGDLQHSLH